MVHCKKRLLIFPSPAGMFTNQTLPGWDFIKLFPTRGDLVSDIPAGDGKINNLFTVYRKLEYGKL
jgi:hypothetical protein